MGTKILNKIVTNLQCQETNNNNNNNHNNNNTNKWYMLNPESILENESHKILWDFEIQTDHPISAR